MTTKLPEISIVTLEELLELPLVIPNYQRPYKWSVRSVTNLINDLLEIGTDTSIDEYRIGTVILADHDDSYDIADGQQRIVTHCRRPGRLCPDAYDIVDGQQRIVTLVLLLKALAKVPANENPPKQISYCIPEGINQGGYLADKTTQECVKRNAAVIARRLRGDIPGKLLDALKKLTFVRIVVSDSSLAFAVFDSQNNRGKKLQPHDLLKAFHLRSMQAETAERPGPLPLVLSATKLVRTWEACDSADLGELFGKYLHRIHRWRLSLPAVEFNEHLIDEFKGISLSDKLAYSQRVHAAGFHFQIGEPFESGRPFFLYTEYYRLFLDRLRKILKKLIRKHTESAPRSENLFNNLLEKPKLTESSRVSIGLRHAWQLFECVCLCFTDKFGPDLIKKDEYFLYLLTWALTPRIQLGSVSFSSINKYVLAPTETGNSNNLFARIAQSRLPSEILGDGTESTAPLEKKITDNVADERRILQRLLLKLNGMDKLNREA